MSIQDEKQKDTWKNIKAYPWENKSYSDKIVKAAMQTGELENDLINLLNSLLTEWHSHIKSNKLKRRYYEGENTLKDLGISIPPTLKNVETVVGWPKKAVSSLASRIRFDGFIATDETISNELNEIMAKSQFKYKFRQAVESQLIAGCDFITVSKGAKGEPPIIITTYSAENCSALWNTRLGRVAAGLVIFEYDENDGTPKDIGLYTDSETINITLVGDRAVIERYPHKIGRPLIFALIYNPTEEKPLGQSRITRAVRSITDSAVREALRTEISAEFFTSPQKYLLGTEKDSEAWQNKTKWEAYIGNIFEITKTEDGTTPQFGQLSQGSMQPHTDYMRSLAMRFSGETNVPVSQLGVIHDNPSSAQAIYAASEPLIIEADLLNEDNKRPLIALAQTAIAIYRDVSIDDLTNEELDILPTFKSPAMPSVVSQADAMIKLASVVEGFAGTEVFWEQVGFSEEIRRRVQEEITRNQARQTARNMALESALSQTEEQE